MCKEPRPMREIHEIQERLYEEEKHLTPKERIAKIHREAQEVKKRLGLNLRKAERLHK